jgi:CRISPR-associated RAMP protein (TIGR02581 family)
MPRFEKLVRRLVLRGRLRLVTGLHIGSGHALAAHEPETPVVKDFFGRPFIPGSSLKGALRSQVEAFLRGMARPDAWACDPIQTPCPLPSDDDDPGAAGRGRDRFRKWGRIVESWDLDRQLAASCTACRLFGSRLFASKLAVPDLPVVGLGDIAWTNRCFQWRDVTAIDRDSDTAADARRLEFEVVPPSTVFRLELILENPEAGRESTAGLDEVGLVLAGLDALRAGWATLGGKRAFGLGRVEPIVDEVEEVTPDLLLSGSPGRTVAGAELGSLLASHRENLVRTLSSEAAHVPSAA